MEVKTGNDIVDAIFEIAKVWGAVLIAAFGAPRGAIPVLDVWFSHREKLLKEREETKRVEYKENSLGITIVEEFRKEIEALELRVKQGEVNEEEVRKDITRLKSNFEYIQNTIDRLMYYPPNRRRIHEDDTL